MSDQSVDVDVATVFRAISDPSRRRMLEILAEGPAGVSDIHRHFSMSQPAVSQHLRALRDAGLVENRPQGRRRVYRLRAHALVGVYDWVSRYERFWDERFDRLGAMLEVEDA